ncbi:DUF423 domain-containing protein [Acaryochloris sp. IP29b_bin.137]|uniref:DUF423 domain-containing protein n=1 Tax=Acaryochloris sp. IP29b_bin.137 TaxID=2969217 RepID=UPI00262E04C0|nr:DUF423 domain-containing protein [Acaryochloris sp. IP29b_bin.137]
MAKLFLLAGSMFGGLSVAAGAFASHALKAQLSERSQHIFETGTKYQMYHALALILVSLISSHTEGGEGLLTLAGYAFIAGIVLFSGSLYGLSLFGIKWFGPITPLGGVAFLVGWGCIAISALRSTPMS